MSLYLSTRIRPSKRGASSQVVNRHSSMDRLDNSSVPPPLVPLTYDIRPPSVSLIGNSIQPDSGVADEKRGAPFDVTAQEGPLARSKRSHLSPSTVKRSPKSSSEDLSVVPQLSPFNTGVARSGCNRELIQGDNQSYFGDSSYLDIFNEDRLVEPETTHNSHQQVRKYTADLPPPSLQEGFIDTYFEYCYTWCPVFERSELRSSSSILLKQALALLGSRIEPPVMQHATPAMYYDRAKALFYGNYEKNPITSLKASLLFYYWGFAPNSLSLDTVWWWTGVAIRQAQQIGLHREPRPGQKLRFNETLGLRRRIWWTLFVCFLPPPQSYEIF